MSFYGIVERRFGLGTHQTQASPPTSPLPRFSHGKTKELLGLGAAFWVGTDPLWRRYQLGFNP
jgi:hypothetical protein